MGIDKYKTCNHPEWMWKHDGIEWLGPLESIHNDTYLISCVECGMRWRWSSYGGWCVDIWTTEEIKAMYKTAKELAEEFKDLLNEYKNAQIILPSGDRVIGQKNDVDNRVPCPKCGRPAIPVMGFMQPLKPICKWCDEKKVDDDSSSKTKYWYAWMDTYLYGYTKLNGLVSEDSEIIYPGSLIVTSSSVEYALKNWKEEIRGLIDPIKLFLAKTPRMPNDQINYLPNKRFSFEMSRRSKDLIKLSVCFCNCDCHKGLLPSLRGHKCCSYA